MYMAGVSVVRYTTPGWMDTLSSQIFLRVQFLVNILSSIIVRFKKLNYFMSIINFMPVQISQRAKGAPLLTPDSSIKTGVFTPSLWWRKTYKELIKGVTFWELPFFHWPNSSMCMTNVMRSFVSGVRSRSCHFHVLCFIFYNTSVV